MARKRSFSRKRKLFKKRIRKAKRYNRPYPKKFKRSRSRYRVTRAMIRRPEIKRVVTTTVIH